MTESANALASTTNMMTNLLLAVALISLVVGGDGVEAIGSQFAEDGQRARIRQRSSREAVRGSSDNQRGREALRPPHRMGRRCRCRRVGGETPTPSGARVG